MIFKYFVFLCFVGLGAAVREIPEYIHVCKRSDPHVARCIRDSVEVLRPRLKTGIPELNVPAIEPLHLDEISVFPSDSQLKAFLRNVNIHRASEFQITKLKLNIAKLAIRVGVKFPKLELDGDYDIDAKVLVVPIKGNGKFSADILDVDGQGVLKGELIQHNGHREMNFTSFDFAIKIGDFDLHLDNLFNGDPILSKAVSEVFNDNRQDLIASTLPYIERKASEILLEAARQITDDLDYDKVFPEK